MEPKHGEMEDLAQFGVEVTRLTGQEALGYYGKGRFSMKFDQGLVTEAELHLRDFFQEQLRSRFPGHRFSQNVQEERSYTHSGQRYLWVFDPLDGVANFQAGIPIWGISLALLDNYWPILGIFYMPATGDLFRAQAGDRAYWGNIAIQVPDHCDLNDESLLLTYSRFHERYGSSFPGKIRNLGCTSAHICYVASGRADATLIAHETYQNLAASRVIVEAAGAKMYRMDGTEFFLDDYLDGNRIAEDLLVVAPGNFPQILSYFQRSP